MITADIAVVPQLKNANATAVWYFGQSCSVVTQTPKSLSNNTAIPAEEEAAARVNVAVT